MCKLLSVIVPVYNVEAYINKCLDSLVVDDPEMMERLEVIIVNDGTPDRSAELSREYVRRFPDTFRQIDKENGGHGSAWNVGLEEAAGKYVHYLDSDDWFTNLDRLLKDLSKCDADIVFNTFIKEYPLEGRSEVIPPPRSESESSSIEESIRETRDWPFTRASFWSCTFKTDILRPLHPFCAEKTMYDDTILYWVSLVYGRTFTSFDYPVYHYLLGRPGQTMSMVKKRSGAVSYWKSFEQYELVRSKTDEPQIPDTILDFIDGVFSTYASFIFPYMVYLPYYDAKAKMAYLWDNYLGRSPHRTHFESRYDRLPFSLFLLVEFIRRRFYLKLFRNE